MTVTMPDRVAKQRETRADDDDDDDDNDDDGGGGGGDAHQLRFADLKTFLTMLNNAQKT